MKDKANEIVEIKRVESRARFNQGRWEMLVYREVVFEKRIVNYCDCTCKFVPIL